MLSKSFAVVLTLLVLMVVGTPLAAQEGDEDAYWERIELARQIAEAHFERAGVLAERGKVDEAVAELEEIRTLPFPPGEEEIEEQMWAVDISIAEFYVGADRFADAERVLKELVDKHADSPRRSIEIYTLLGRCARGQGQDDQALDYLGKAIQLGRSLLDEP
ncbi:MAG: tetratricopeptide repeat protein [Acidobacteriota bacterium]